MKSIAVPFIKDFNNLDEAGQALAALPSHSINQVSWAEYPYLPSATFKIAYSSKAIFLEYEVSEKHLQALYHKTNDPVYKDSCVEFFISFDEEHYYNFEFNSIGTALVGYGGSDKDSRLRLPAELIETIQVASVIEERKQDEEQQWMLTLKIPFTLFYKNDIQSLKAVSATANFYKCGDDLPEPHFVSWNKIEVEEPNFHLPEYFGTIEFI